MKRFCYLVLLLLLKAELSAQVAQPAGKLNVNTAPGGIVEEILFDKIPERIGSHYLHDDWLTGNIYLKSGQKVKGKPLKYDLQTQVVRIRFDGVVKALKVSRVLRFELINAEGNSDVFINADLFKNENEISTGFFKLVQDGGLRLFSMTELQLVKANYAPTHNAGEMSDKYLKTDHFYFEKEMKVFKVSKNKNKSLKFFGTQAETVKNFMSENRLGFKKEQDLIQLVGFYNSQN